MIPVPKPTRPPKITRISVKDWMKGTVTALDDGRTPTDGLRTSGNLMLDQDGTLRPRPSMVPYGTTLPGTALGEIYEFTKENGANDENYLIGMFNVSGITKPWYSKDGGAWTVINGKTFSTTAKAHFAQVDQKILVMNGVDNLSYVDIPTFATIPFLALAAPTITSVTATGMTGTTFTYYYKVTANSTVGETASSAATSVSVEPMRDLWNPSTQYVTVVWPAVTGATSYNVYMGTVSGSETLISAGVNGLSFKDDGSTVADVTRVAPVGDTTAGPKVTRATVINGQVFMTGDADNPDYVRFGGTGTDVLDFSPFNGGGYSELGRGAKETPVRVVPFRDGQGTSQITVLCKGTNGQGKRYLMIPTTTTYGSTVISYMKVVEDNGQAGTDSPDGVVVYNDAIWYPSRDGMKTTATKPQLQTILSTDTVSETILNDVKNLNSLYMPGAVGLAYQQRLYFALPVGTSSNNEIWVLDLARQGAWMKPWSIAADWMVLYNDNSGSTHHLVLSGNALYELTDSQASYDSTTPFATNATSGLIKFSEDGLEWAKVIDINFIVLRPQGTLNFTVAGRTEESLLQAVGTSSYTASSSIAGWGEAGFDTSGDGSIAPTIFGWSNFSEIPVTFGDAQRLITIEVDEELQWITWELNTNTGGTFFQLADVIIRSVNIGVKDLTGADETTSSVPLSGIVTDSGEYIIEG